MEGSKVRAHIGPYTGQSTLTPKPCNPVASQGAKCLSLEGLLMASILIGEAEASLVGPQTREPTESPGLPEVAEPLRVNALVSAVTQKETAEP